MIHQVVSKINSPSSTTAYYDKSAKSWRAGDNDRHSFGTGKDAKQSAELAAIATDAPEAFASVIEIWHQADNDPDVLNRLIPAAQLLITGSVFRDGFVTSQSRDHVLHKVTHAGTPKTYHCTCEDFEFRGAELSGIGQVCKHVLSHHLAYLLDWPIEANVPVPFNGEAAYIEVSNG